MCSIDEYENIRFMSFCLKEREGRHKYRKDSETHHDVSSMMGPGRAVDKDLAPDKGIKGDVQKKP